MQVPVLALNTRPKLFYDAFIAKVVSMCKINTCCTSHVTGPFVIAGKAHSLL